MPSQSPIALNIPYFCQVVDRTFTNVFSLSGPFRETDIVPGDRYGLLNYQSYAANSDSNRLALTQNKIRLGVEAKEITGIVVIRSAFDVTGMSESDRLLQENITFLEEALNLEHGFAQMKSEIPDMGVVFEFEITGAIDKRSFISLRDRDTVVVDTTADFRVSIGILRGLDGTHILPISATPNL